MSDYDYMDDVDAAGGGSFLRFGVHEVQIVEVTDTVSKHPKRRGALKYAIQAQVITSTPQDGAHAHYPGEMVGVVFFHGPGSSGYDPSKGTSYGDKDIKGFLSALVAGVGKNPAEVQKWGPIARGVVEAAQTARDIRVRVRVYGEAGKDKVTKAPLIGADGKPVIYPRQVFEPVLGQTDKAALLLAGVEAPASRTQTAQPPAVTAAPTAPRPSAPPGPPRPGAPLHGSAEVIAAAKDWLRAGSTVAETAQNLAAWGAESFGLTSAQVASLVQTAASSVTPPLPAA